MAVDMFLEVEGVQGDSQDKAHPGAIVVESFSWGLSNPTTIGSASGGAGAGKVSLQDFHFTMATSKASAQLLQACSTGMHFPKATFSLRNAGGHQADFMSFVLSEVLVSSYAIGSNLIDTGFSPLAGDAEPTDQVTLAFATFMIHFTPQTGQTGATSTDQGDNEGG